MNIKDKGLKIICFKPIRRIEIDFDVEELQAQRSIGRSGSVVEIHNSLVEEFRKFLESIN